MTAVAAAKKILSAARSKAREIRAQAQREGLEAARREAASLLFAAEAYRRRAASNTADSLIQLALEVVDAVVGETLSSQPQLVRARIMRALSQYCSQAELQLAAHPEDEPDAKRAIGEFTRAAGGSASITLALDASLPRGAFRIRAPGCELTADARLHFAAIRDALMQPSAPGGNEH